MQKPEWKHILWGVVISVLLLTGACSSSKYQMHDGYYCAEAKEFDDNGWKEYVTIFVSSGQIILVEYNAFNEAGFLKSWDMDFMREMNASNNTNPNAYTRYYAGKLLNYQKSQDIDILSGATYSYYIFIQLAEAAINSAKQGKTETATVKLNRLGNIPPR